MESVEKIDKRADVVGDAEHNMISYYHFLFDELLKVSDLDTDALTRFNHITGELNQKLDIKVNKLLNIGSLPEPAARVKAKKYRNISSQKYLVKLINRKIESYGFTLESIEGGKVIIQSKPTIMINSTKSIHNGEVITK